MANHLKEISFYEAVNIVCMNCAYKEGYDYNFEKDEYVKTEGEWVPPCERCMVRKSVDLKIHKCPNRFVK